MATPNLEGTVSDVISSEMKPLFNEMDLLDFNNEFLNKHKFSLPHQLAGKLVILYWNNLEWIVCSFQTVSLV